MDEEKYQSLLDFINDSIELYTKYQQTADDRADSFIGENSIEFLKQYGAAHYYEGYVDALANIRSILENENAESASGNKMEMPVL